VAGREGAGAFLKALEREQGGSGRFGSSQAETNQSDYASALEEAGIPRPTALAPRRHEHDGLFVGGKGGDFVVMAPIQKLTT